MIWDIVCHTDIEDDFNLPETDAENSLDIYLGKSILDGGIREDIDTVFAKNHCSPTPLARDLLNIALITYSADRIIRRDWGYLNWERGINIHAPVFHIGHWEKALPVLQKILNFLSDDRWRFYFRPTDLENNSRGKSKQQSKSYSTAALLSGGLDSFIGAIDLFENSQKSIALVSHHSQSGQIRTIQRDVVSVLNKHYPNRGVEFNFFVQPPKVEWDLEHSSRTRSFLFLALAVAVASSLKIEKINLSENGFMSINVPLSRSRVGSHSTRTTHPNFLNGYQELLDVLGISVSVENPYQFVTKGEMIEQCLNKQILIDGILQTHSCSRSNILRFKGYSPRGHCGYCLPCLIRNAATYKAGVKDVNYLRTDEIRITQKKDLWALKKLLLQYETGKLDLASQVAKAGPFQDSIDIYVDVYNRGLQELLSICEKTI